MSVLIEEKVYWSWCKRWKTVYVSLPVNYNKKSDEEWRVIYMLDGESSFMKRAEKKEWSFCIDEKIDEIILKDQDEGAIVVAVQSVNEYDDLWQKYSYPRDHEYSFNDDLWVGWGQELAKWLIFELKPYIERKYAVTALRTKNSIWGSSLSGTYALWLALKYAKYFGSGVAFSPGVSFDDGLDMASYKREFQNIMEVNYPLNLYLDVGTCENVPGGMTSNKKYLEDVERFFDGYLKCVFTENLKIKFEIIKDAEHTTKDWQKRLLPVYHYIWGNY